jgi:uncharacterized SAM-binding protein YcdF (DUF218 family)
MPAAMVTYILPKLAELLLRPSMALLLLALLGLILRRPPLTWVGVVGMLAILILPLDQWLARPLEDAVPRPALPPRVDGVVALGGAVEEDIFADRGTPALNAAAERMTEFLALARTFPGARLVFTGGSGRIVAARATQADEARAQFDELGLPPARVTFEGASRSTWQNAVLARRAVRPAPGQTWLLVTSALHMPRALGAFRAAGWAVLPWPVGYKTLRHGLRWIEPPSQRIGLLEAALHEWVGLLAYRISGHWAGPPDRPRNAPQDVAIRNQSSR